MAHKKPCYTCQMKERPGVYLSATDFIAKDPYTLFRFAYCADPKAFRKKFSEYGIDIRDDEDIEALTILERDGEYKGNRFERTPMQIFSELELDLAEVDRCGVRFKDIDKIK